MDTTTHTKVATISVAGSPTGLAVTPDGLFVWVACQGANNVKVLSTVTNTVVGTIPVGTTPVQVAITPNGTQAYVVIRGLNQVAVIDTVSQSVIATVPVGSRPVAVTISPDGSKAYVANLYDGTVSVISTASKSVINTFAADQGSSGVAVLPNGRVYVSNQNAGNVTVHDASGNLLATIPGFTSPNWAAAAPNGSRVFVTNGNSKSVGVVDTSSNTLISTITTGTIPTSVAVSADSAHAYVVNEYSFSLSEIGVASNTVTNTLSSVGVYPFGIAIAPASGAPQCTFSLSSTSASFSSAGGTGSVNVTAPAGCAWTAVSNQGWSQITGGASGSGNGTVTFSVNANGGNNPLTGTLTIASQTFTINEAGLACSYSLSSSSTSVGSGVGGGSVNMIAGSGCTWNATSDSQWLSITAGFSGSGNGAISFSVTANPGTGPRIGNLTIGGQNFAVTQAGVGFTPIRVNCGGPQVTDGNGNVWVAGGEQNFTMSNVSISGTATPSLYQSEAWSTGMLQYQYTVPNGSFTVKLKFAEFYLTQLGQRTFNIVVNGATFYSSFDIFASVGGMAADDVSIPMVVNNGQITIQLVPVTGRAKLNAIEIF